MQLSHHLPCASPCRRPWCPRIRLRRRTETETATTETEKALPPVTSCLYLHRPGAGSGALDKDAMLRCIRHRRRANRPRDTLRSMLQAPPPPPEPDNSERQLSWLDDAYSTP
ncbi:uncharacterized protein LOC133904455 [Phragmites australis]|uniref:uncharacterized protein LOC133904455 n=1 Tax=Phragmites australis TaxID=29695 RepID=UPI002D77F3BE|nr:uncharacterized protein LOC133904455 [Phragmites australis]